PDLANDSDYKTNSLRLRNRDALVPQLVEVMKTEPRDTWIERLQQAGVPCGPINNLDQVFDHPQVRARDVWRTVDHPLAGSAPTTANPIRYSGTPVQYRMAPPLLGQHTDEVLAEFGLTLPQQDED